MRVHLVTPAPPRTSFGNRITAQRWARILTGLGHDVTVALDWQGDPADLLLALHARRSAPAIARFADARPGAPIVVALTGTDLYRDLATSAAARRSLELADALVVLQELAVEELPRHLRGRTHVVHQSVPSPSARAPRPDGELAVLVLAHLRGVKDPLLPAEASRLLPRGSRVRVTHLGAALDDGMADRARREAAANPRYDWLGERPRAEALDRLAASHLLVLSSRLEGGANVVSEALAFRTPVLATRIPGSVGLLGADYPGYFPVGDAPALAGLLRRAEAEPDFYAALEHHVDARAVLVDPASERTAWAELLAALP